MNLQLSPYHFVAVHAEDVVILDTRLGRYSLLAGAADQVRLSADGRGVCITEPRVSEDLRKAGVASSHDERQLPLLFPSAPARSALEGPDPSLRLSDGTAMGLAWLDMLGHYYGRSFFHLVQTARRGFREASRNDVDPDGLLRRAQSFDRLSPWTPFQGDCLFRAFMLLRLLQRSGYQARWVFGVRTWPFYAHCWLQVGDVALTDFAETLASFTPIFVV